MPFPVMIAMNSFRIGGSQTYAWTLARLLADTAGYPCVLVGKRGPLALAARSPNQPIRVIQTIWREGHAEQHYSFTANSVLTASEYLLAIRLQRLGPLSAIIASQPRPTSFMAKFRETRHPQTPLYGLVHGTLPVEFPPHAPERTIPRVDKWFATTPETHKMLTDTTDDVSFLGNLFRGRDYWGTPPVVSTACANDLRVLFCGTLTPNKTAPLQAALMALPELPGCHLTIVGDGPGRHELSRTAHQLGLSKQVVFLGAVNDVKPHIIRANCVIAAGRAAIEAASGGRPVIIASSEGIHGVLTQESYVDAEASNFTGRSRHSESAGKDSLLRALSFVPELGEGDLLALQRRTWEVGTIEPLLNAIASQS